MHESGRATPNSCLCADMPHANLESEQETLLEPKVTQFFNIVTPRVMHEANVANVACNQCTLCGLINKPYEAFSCSLSSRAKLEVDEVNRCKCHKCFPKSAVQHFIISTPRFVNTKEIADFQPNFRQ